MPKMIRLPAALVVLAALTVLSGMSKSDRADHGADHGAGQAGKIKMEKMKEDLAKPSSRAGTDEALLAAGFDAVERQLIRDYFHDRPTPPEALPPGIAKNLARGKPLPPGIAKRFLPEGLVDQLPARPGYERILVGDDVVLVEAATQIIVDVLNDVLAP